MSDSFDDQPHVQDERVTAQEPAALREQLSDAAGVGRAQRSEPERSGGERSGARPTPATSHPLLPALLHPRPNKQVATRRATMRMSTPSCLGACGSPAEARDGGSSRKILSRHPR